MPKAGGADAPSVSLILKVNLARRRSESTNTNKHLTLFDKQKQLHGDCVYVSAEFIQRNFLRLQRRQVKHKKDNTTDPFPLHYFVISHITIVARRQMQSQARTSVSARGRAKELSCVAALSLDSSSIAWLVCGNFLSLPPFELLTSSQVNWTTCRLVRRVFYECIHYGACIQPPSLLSPFHRRLLLYSTARRLVCVLVAHTMPPILYCFRPLLPIFGVHCMKSLAVP